LILNSVNIKTAGKSTEQLIEEIVEAINTLQQNVQLALQNVDMSDVVSEFGVSLEVLLKQGALKGETGAQGAPGRIWLPDIDAAGNISWTLTDMGGVTPEVRNIKGAKGEKGNDGAGVPAGGSAGQILVKLSDADYDTAWKTV